MSRQNHFLTSSAFGQISPLPRFPHIELAYHTHGPAEAQTLVLIHGLSNSRQTYDPLIDWLVSKGVWVVAVDLRGHGESGWAESYKTSDFVSDVVDLIEASDLGPVIAVGHSLGGMVASAMASDHPELVRALFLEDPPLFQADEEIRNADRSVRDFPEFAEQVRGWQRDNIGEEEVAAEYGASESPYPGVTMLDLLGARRLRTRVSALLRCDPAAIEAAASGEMWEGLDPRAPIRCPVTLLAADPSLDGMFLPDHADWYRELVPQAQIIRVDGAAHSIRLHEKGLHLYKEALAALIGQA